MRLFPQAAQPARPFRSLALAAMGVFALAGPALAQPYGYREPAEGSPQMQREIERQMGYRDGYREDRRGYGAAWREQDRVDYRDERRRREAESSREWLKEAQDAVQRGNLAQANEFLERAATRMLTRDIEPHRAGEAMSSRQLAHINEARQALWRRDRRDAAREIDLAIASR